MSRIDLSQPPYQVPCPTCRAFAMALCKNGFKLLTEPHESRWSYWGLNPAMRVKVTLDTYVRWDESFEQWANRMKIHCPTARSFHELMFFAAEKLDMTTEDYLAHYFPEEIRPGISKLDMKYLP